MADMKIYQEVELSLTENLIPTVIHVKQFDHKARKVRCLLYTSSVEYTIPEGAIVSCAGTGRMGTCSNTVLRPHQSWCPLRIMRSCLLSRIS